jgi:hypothetical protein
MKITRFTKFDSKFACPPYACYIASQTQAMILLKKDEIQTDGRIKLTTTGYSHHPIVIWAWNTLISWTATEQPAILQASLFG